MTSLISRLSEQEQRELLEDINYLNMSEIKTFCKKHSIPYSIWIETKDGRLKKTLEDDRKGIILNRIRHYLTTGEIPPATCFPANVACFDDVENIKETDLFFYGQYNKNSSAIIGLLKKLTNGKFKNGAIARILAREFWSKAIAPPYLEYAQAWIKAYESHSAPNPEWAFLSDLASGKDASNWKQLRINKANQVLSILNSL